MLFYIFFVYDEVERLVCRLAAKLLKRPFAFWSIRSKGLLTQKDWIQENFFDQESFDFYFTFRDFYSLEVQSKELCWMRME